MNQNFSRLVPSKLLAVIFSVFYLTTLVQTVRGQGFDVEEYLKRIDKNKNGVLEESEMSGRTERFIERLGFDTKKPVSIRKVVSKVNKDRKERDQADKGGGSKELKVPGFAVDTTAEKAKVVGFTSDPGQVTTTRVGGASKEVSEEIKKQVKDALDRYDRNKDGILDEREIRNGRWGTPSPAESDKNRDGKLSQDELTQRYIDRQRFYNARNSSRTSSGGSSGQSQAVKEAQAAAAAREKFRNSGTTSSSSRSSTSSSRRSTRPSSSSSNSNSNSAKYESYANGLIAQYDTNKNGALDKEEIAKMRRPPKADANGDGIITKTELIDQLTGKTKASDQPKEEASKTASTSKSRTSYSNRSSGSTRRSSRSSGGSFDDLDVNKDGRIHMYEYSQEWTEELVEKFNEKDKNGDGIISQKEWNSTSS